MGESPYSQDGSMPLYYCWEVGVDVMESHLRRMAVVSVCTCSYVCEYLASFCLFSYTLRDYVFAWKSNYIDY